MGLLDKMRAYLNEEDKQEPDKQETDKQEVSMQDTGMQEDELQEDEPEELEVSDRKPLKLKGKKASYKIDISSENSKEKKSLFSFLKRKKETEEEDDLGDISRLKQEARKRSLEETRKRASALYINEENPAASADTDERKLVADFCEQLVDVSYNLEDMKREYQVVTSYLTDIQRIEELPVSLANEIIDSARKIEMLDKNRQTYLQSENLLPMDKYNNIASVEEEVPETIKKMYDTEMRDSVLKNDMGHLEGEKEDLRFLRNELSSSINRTRGIMAAVMAILLLALCTMLGISVLTKNSVTIYALGAGAAALITFAICFARYKDMESDIRLVDAKVNRAISLLNKVKVKFINNTNTLDYMYAKYQVNSSKELEYQWEQYNIMLKDARKYAKANNEFRVYCDELVGKLTSIGIKDPLVWPKQTRALIDRREMVEIKHGLNVRRQKIRDQVAICDKIRSNAQLALKAAITANPGLESYVTGLLASYNLHL